MRKLSLIVAAGAVLCMFLWGADWPTQSGGPQRDGWAKAEKAITKENVKNIELLYKFKTDNQARGPNALTSPIIDGNLITYKGFKEMLVFGGSSDNVYSVDADLDRLIWKAHLEYKGDKPEAAPTALCPGGLTAPVTMPGSSSAAGRTFGGPRPAAGAARPAGAPPAPPAPRGPNASLLASGFGRAGVFFAIGGDGYLHALNTSTGGDRLPPMKFLPANAKVSAINVNDNMLYAATLGNCGGNANALYAIDPTGENPQAVSFPTNGSGLAGVAGTAIGTNGIVYAQVASGHGDEAGEYHDTVLALDPHDLKVKDYFTPSGGGKGGDMAGITPIVFTWKSKDLIVAGGSDGRLYVLDSASLGGADHHTPLSQTEPVAQSGFSGTFASWEDAETATRWLYAPLSAGAKGSIAAFKVEEKNGQPALTAAWTSRDLGTTAPVAIANGVVFVLSTGEKPATHATLYALDAATGKELYSSGNAASTFSHGSGLAVANGRVYFTTHDNSVLCFGFRAANPQLTDK